VNRAQWWPLAPPALAIAWLAVTAWLTWPPAGWQLALIVSGYSLATWGPWLTLRLRRHRRDRAAVRAAEHAVRTELGRMQAGEADEQIIRWFREGGTS
jgi:hypothetical protein